MPPGDVIGFEVVSAGEGGVDHTWHCYDYPRWLSAELSELGLLRSYDEARVFAERLRTPEPRPDRGLLGRRDADRPRLKASPSGSDRVELGDVLGREHQPSACDVLAQVRDGRRAGDQQDVG